jgi:hypothetical protein
MTSQIADRPSRRALFWGTGIALAAGAAAVVLFVLPAETSIDPTAVGKSSGLSSMANPRADEALKRGQQHPNVFTASTGHQTAEPGLKDHFTYELAPYEEIELKYVLDQGAPITFSWKADGPLNYDLHAQPFDGGEALTESYAVKRADQQAGRYVAAFAGIHGWHWHNRTLSTVHLTLDTSGRMKGSKLFGPHGEQDRPLSPPAS